MPIGKTADAKAVVAQLDRTVLVEVRAEIGHRKQRRYTDTVATEGMPVAGIGDLRLHHEHLDVGALEQR
jgi:hypothetical protein